MYKCDIRLLNFRTEERNILIVLRGPSEIFTHFILHQPFVIVVPESNSQYLILNLDDRCVVPHIIIRAIYDIPSLQRKLPVPLRVWYLSLVWRQVPWIFLDRSLWFVHGYLITPFYSPIHCTNIMLVTWLMEMILPRDQSMTWSLSSAFKASTSSPCYNESMKRVYASLNSVSGANCYHNTIITLLRFNTARFLPL